MPVFLKAALQALLLIGEVLLTKFTGLGLAVACIAAGFSVVAYSWSKTGEALDPQAPENRL